MEQIKTKKTTKKRDGILDEGDSGCAVPRRMRNTQAGRNAEDVIGRTAFVPGLGRQSRRWCWKVETEETWEVQLPTSFAQKAECCSLVDSQREASRKVLGSRTTELHSCRIRSNYGATPLGGGFARKPTDPRKSGATNSEIASHSSTFACHWTIISFDHACDQARRYDRLRGFCNSGLLAGTLDFCRDRTWTFKIIMLVQCNVAQGPTRKDAWWTYMRPCLEMVAPLSCIHVRRCARLV